MRLALWASAAYASAVTLGYFLGATFARRHNVESASFIFLALLLGTVALRRSVPEDGRDAPLPAWRISRLIAVFVAASMLLYAPLLTAGLFADDFVLLDAARQGRWTVWSDLFRPMLFAVWRVVDRLPVPVALTLHLLNAGLHGVNAALVAALARRAACPRWVAAGAGALFVCFPASVEPVAWPAVMQDVLAAACVLVFLVLVTARRTSTVRTVIAFVFLVAACLTKEVAAAAAVLAPLLCFAFRAGRRAWKLAIASTILVLGLMVIRFAVLPVPLRQEGLPGRYELKELLVRPYGTLIVPFRSSEASDRPWLAAGLALILPAALAVASQSWRRNSTSFRLGVALAVGVLAATAPVNFLFFIDANLQGSRYLYLAAAMWSMLLAHVFHEAGRRWKPLGPALLIVTIAGWSVATLAHVRLWREAAADRDRILDAAAGLAVPGCDELRVVGLPAFREGVPVFVNGFPEALRQRGATLRVSTADAGGGPCSIVWQGTSFRKE